jgi:hypothetical protein
VAGPPGQAGDWDRVLRALLYHSGRELLTDWPGLFAAAGFQLERCATSRRRRCRPGGMSKRRAASTRSRVQARYGRRLAPGIARRIDRQVAHVAAAAVFIATKFTSGAWVVVLTVPALMLLFSRIQNYYRIVGLELDWAGSRTARCRPAAW